LLKGCSEQVPSDPKRRGRRLADERSRVTFNCAILNQTCSFCAHGASYQAIEAIEQPLGSVGAAALPALPRSEYIDEQKNTHSVSGKRPASAAAAPHDFTRRCRLQAKLDVL
jgi:hypothetical protein